MPPGKSDRNSQVGSKCQNFTRIPNVGSRGSPASGESRIDGRSLDGS